MTAFFTFLAKNWRESLIAALVAALIFCYSVVQARNDTIKERDIEITKITATSQTDAKWSTATTAMLQTVIQNQNQSIQDVLLGIKNSSDQVTRAMDATRKDNAQKTADLKKAIKSMPKATSCEAMMDNLIKTGKVTSW